LRGCSNNSGYYNYANLSFFHITKAENEQEKKCTNTKQKLLDAGYAKCEQSQI